ncbi:unnamed protein product [Prorocentrum cordatum]|uniref:Uncharacterized protein n=1 Tax=Prorocentrum cordatum TaxID=2364126 RepID=A0ABN9X5K4_9DINO|nr:unnamed protein product [Polarella glacialis]
MAQPWGRQFPVIRHPLTVGPSGSDVRKVVTGPAGIAMVTTHELSWEMADPLHIERGEEAARADVREGPPLELNRVAERSIHFGLFDWAHATDERSSLRPAPGLLPFEQVRGRQDG